MFDGLVSHIKLTFSFLKGQLLSGLFECSRIFCAGLMALDFHSFRQISVFIFQELLLIVLENKMHNVVFVIQLVHPV